MTDLYTVLRRDWYYKFADVFYELFCCFAFCSCIHKSEFPQSNDRRFIMKTIAVIGTLEEEINSIKSEMEIISAKNIVGLDFVMGKMFGNNVVLVRSGIGKVNASICTQILIDMYAVDYIINVTTAGILGGEMTTGDIVISDDVCYHDFDASFFGVSKGVIYRMDESFFKADPELIALSSKASEDNGLNTVVGRIVTGDKLVYESSEKSDIKNEFKALCVDMESGAVAHTCYLNKIPFVIISLLFEDFSENTSEVFSSSMINAYTETVKKVIDMIK